MIKRIFAALLALACLTAACAEEAPRFELLSDAVDYLRESAELCLDPIEIYVDELEEIADSATLPRRLRVLTAQHTVHAHWNTDSGWISIDMLYYPGTLIAHAAETGDPTALTAEEFAAMNLAVRLAEDLKGASDLETEIAIHNWLCDSVEYEDAPDYTGGDIPRMCTAVGALLDGRANCQGYSDTFYLLARLAGLNVRRQDGWCDGIAHQWNLVELDGEWYIVDVTHNDMDDPGAWQYMWMNVGLDLAGSYEWYENESVATVANKTDPDLFYYIAHGLLFDSAASLAEHAVAEWMENPEFVANGMLFDVSCTSDDLHDAVGDALRDVGMDGAWTLWRVSANGHTFCRIILNGEE